MYVPHSASLHAGYASLPADAAHDVHQFSDLAPLVGLVAAGNGVFNAMRNVVTEDFLLDPPQRGAYGLDLRDDVDAITIVLDHAGKAAHLTFNAAQSFDGGTLAVFAHKAYIPPQGIYRKRAS